MKKERHRSGSDWMAPVFRYGFAVVMACIATALKVALAAYIVPTFILAYPAVLAAGALGGIGPGILATVLSGIMAWYWVLATPGDFHSLSAQEASGLALFVVMGVLMSWLAERLRRSQGRVELLERERALKETEAKFRTYVESAPDALFVEDAHGRFLDANPAGLDLLGVDLETLRSGYVVDFVPEEDRGLVLRKFEALSTVDGIDYDRRFLRPDGRIIDAHVRAVKLGPDRVMAYCRDITDRKRTEDALRESEARFRTLVEWMPVAILVGSKNQEILRLNEGFVRMFGYNLEDIPTAREWFLRAYPDDDYRRSVMEAWDRQLEEVRAEGGEFAPFETQVTCKGGEVRFVLLAATFLDENLVTAFTDITTRKQAEEALRASEAQYRTLIDNLNAGVIVHAPDTSVILNNAKASLLLGLTAERMRAKGGAAPDWRFLHEDGTRMPPQEHPVVRVIATNRPVVNEVIGVDNPGTGRRAWLLTTAYPEFDEANRLRQVVVTFLDITRRREAETVLLETELRLRSVVGAAPLILWEVDRAGKVLLSVGRALGGLGLEPNQIVGQSVYEVYRDAPETNANIERCLAGEEFSADVSVAGRLWSNHYTPVRDGRGSVSGVVGVSIDTTDRHLAETALRASEARFRALSDTAPVGIFEADAEGRNIYMNPAGAEILGLAPDEARGTGWKDAIHPEEREQLVRDWGSAVAAGKVFTGRFRCQKPGGPLVTALLYAAPVRDQTGRPTAFVGAMVDVTRQLELEKKLQQATRLAAMGTLVAGLAHEINNPLAAEISGQGVALEIVREFRGQAREGGLRELDQRIHQLDGAIEALEDAQEGGQRIARIVRDMAMLARPDFPRSSVRLRDAVDDGLRMSPATVSEAARLNVEDRGAPNVLAAAGQLAQVVANLVSNAFKATEADKLAEIVVRIRTGEVGQAVLEVSDHGVGMAPQILDRIFDPFFTTRQVGEKRGTGLGLSICKAIVDAHGGTLTVRSEAGKGSTFTLELPAAPAKA